MVYTQHLPNTAGVVVSLQMTHEPLVNNSKNELRYRAFLTNEKRLAAARAYAAKLEGTPLDSAKVAEALSDTPEIISMLEEAARTFQPLALDRDNEEEESEAQPGKRKNVVLKPKRMSVYRSVPPLNLSLLELAHSERDALTQLAVWASCAGYVRGYDLTKTARWFHFSDLGGELQARLKYLGSDPVRLKCMAEALAEKAGELVSNPAAVAHMRMWDIATRYPTLEALEPVERWITSDVAAYLAGVKPKAITAAAAKREKQPARSRGRSRPTGVKIRRRQFFYEKNPKHGWEYELKTVLEYARSRAKSPEQLHAINQRVESTFSHKYSTFEMLLL